MVDLLVDTPVVSVVYKQVGLAVLSFQAVDRVDRVGGGGRSLVQPHGGVVQTGDVTRRGHLDVGEGT